MKNTKIEWTDATWNPVMGFLDDDLIQPLRWKKQRHIFVRAHRDLFHESALDRWIDRVFAVMALAKRHTFKVLTERPDRARAYLLRLALSAKRLDTAARTFGYALEFQGEYLVSFPIPNVWIGITVCNQEEADRNIPILLQTPAAKRFLSIEPLLGKIVLPHSWCDRCKSTHSFKNINGALCPKCGDDCGININRHIDWVIVGGETGAKARPMHPKWVTSIAEECLQVGVPFFFKGWGEWLPASSGQGGRVGAWNGDTFVDGCGDIKNPDNNMVRAGRRVLGARILNGREWNEVPE